MKHVALCLLVTLATLHGSDRFEFLGKYRDLGGTAWTAVGPGPTPGSERVYISYLYLNHTIDLVSVDPETGHADVFPCPFPGESAGRGIISAPDGNMYLGTAEHGHMLKLDVKAGKLIDLGRPSSTETYLWESAIGSDGKVYAVTYPQAKLVRCDPKSGALEDLGRMDPHEMYAHHVIGSDDGFVYVGIGTTKANIAAYEIATGRHRELLPADAQIVGQARVWRGQDGKMYGAVSSTRMFRLEGWKAVELTDPALASPAPKPHLRDGRTVEVTGRTLALTDPKTQRSTAREFSYQGNKLPIFRVNFGPDGVLYGSTILPIHLIKYEAEGQRLTDVGDVGEGEVYSFLPAKGRLLMAAYSALAPLMSFDPAKPFSVAAHNPKMQDRPEHDNSWRTEAMIQGPDGKVYMGSVSGYGKLGGPITVWDVGTGKVEEYPHVLRDHSVISLAFWKDRLVGGTTIGGGGGSHPTQTEAKLFLWEPNQHKVEFEDVPVPGAQWITDLVTAPNGKVYGFASGTLFIFDPQARTVKRGDAMHISQSAFNSAGIGPDGAIWGLAVDGIFRIDPKTDGVSLVAKSPERITAGFAMRDGYIYCASDASLYRFRM